MLLVLRGFVASAPKGLETKLTHTAIKISPLLGWSSEYNHKIHYGQ